MDDGYRIVSGRSQVRVLPLAQHASVAQLVERLKHRRLILVRIFLFFYRIAGWSSLVARKAHNLEAARSNRAPATNFYIMQGRQVVSRNAHNVAIRWFRLPSPAPILW